MFTAGSVIVPVGAPVVQAATLTFTVTQGNYVDDPPLGACETGVGECSLRGALLEAQVRMAEGDDVVIEFAPGLDGVEFQAPGGAGTANPAVYHVLVPAGRSLTIGSNQARPRLTGDDQNRLFAFLGAGSVTLTNLDLSGGRVFDLPPGRDGGTILVDDSAATLALTDVAIAGGGAFGDSGAIRTAGMLSLDRVSIDDTTAGGQGGAIYSTGAVTIENSTILGTLGDTDGGAIALSGSSSLVLRDSMISSATTGGGSGSGGAIFCDCDSVTVVGSTLDGNRAGSGGGAIWSVGGWVDISDSNVIGNGTLSGQGGAVALYVGARLAARNSAFDLNVASAETGGAISCNTCDWVDISDSAFTENSARAGGAVSSEWGGPTTIVGSAFTDNRASEQGGAVLVDSIAPVDLSGSRFTSNDAISGGAVWSARGELSVRSSVFDANSAAVSGGGLMCFQCTAVTVENATFVDNVMTLTGSQGGGAYIDGGDIEITNTTFSGNAAEAGAGAGLYATSSQAGPTQAVLSHVTIVGHRTEGVDAAALTVEPALPVTVRNSIIADNEINCDTISGGVVFDGDGQPNIVTPDDGGAGCPIVNSTVVDLDPQLAPLAGRGGPNRAGGGPIPVHAIDGTSVASNLTTCAGGVDARGMARPTGPCDVGAFELDLAVATDNVDGPVVGAPAAIVSLDAVPASALSKPVGNGSADSQALTTAQVRGSQPLAARLARLGLQHREHRAVVRPPCPERQLLVGHAAVGVEAEAHHPGADPLEELAEPIPALVVGQDLVADQLFGHLVSEATAVNNIAEIESDRGRYDEARTLLRGARRSWRAIGFGVGIALAQSNLGRLATRTGDHDEAVPLLSDAITRFDALGMPAMAGDARLRLVENALLAGGTVADDWWPADADLDDDVVTQIYLERLRAVAAHVDNRPADADRWSASAVERARAAGVPFDLALALRVRRSIVGDVDPAEIDAIHTRLGIVAAPRVVPEPAATAARRRTLEPH